MVFGFFFFKEKEYMWVGREGRESKFRWEEGGRWKGEKGRW